MIKNPTHDTRGSGPCQRRREHGFQIDYLSHHKNGVYTSLDTDEVDRQHFDHNLAKSGGDGVLVKINKVYLFTDLLHGGLRTEGGHIGTDITVRVGRNLTKLGLVEYDDSNFVHYTIAQD